jgi:hypothetical protein
MLPCCRDLEEGFRLRAALDERLLDGLVCDS